MGTDTQHKRGSAQPTGAKCSLSACQGLPRGPDGILIVSVSSGVGTLNSRPSFTLERKALDSLGSKLLLNNMTVIPSRAFAGL